METLKLQRINISHFKGITSFGMTLNGDNAVITAENGVGKTTVYDAFLWLLFGKDSTGRKEFELRPLNRHNQPFKGLVVGVEADIDINGTVHTLRKEHHEKVVKEQLRGYETECWIDWVPKKVGEYQEYMNETISEDTFKLLTDLTFFNDKFHWTDRRMVLLDIAGDVGTPEGFAGLLANLNGRKIEDYKKVLKSEKEGYVKERDEINPRIDEILRGLEHPKDIDVEDLQKQRTSLNAQIENLKTQRQGLYGKETERQEKIEAINVLKTQRSSRESELKNDTSEIEYLFDEKANIAAEVSSKTHDLSSAENALSLKQTQQITNNERLNSLTSSLADIQDEHTFASQQKATEVCYACGQKLPDETLAENKKKRQEKLAEITSRGNELKRKVDSLKLEIAKVDKELAESRQRHEAAMRELDEARKSRDKRYAEIDEAIQNRTEPDVTKDETWQKITAEIERSEKELGSSVAEQLNAIEAQRAVKDNELNKLNETLAQADRLETDRKRVKELEAREKELAQKIAEVERQLEDIALYQKAESQLIEAEVNDRFEYVNFKLFNELLNGTLEPCCEALLDGVPYKDMSAGQQIRVGIDIINVLSEHYRLSVPLFIDHAESVTYPLASKGQTIELCAKKDITELQVTKKTRTEAKAVA